MKKIIYSAMAIALGCVAVSCSNSSTIKSGSPVKGIDSLSYCLGANISMGIQAQMGEITFDYETMEKGLKEGALAKAKETQEESVDILRDYFTNRMPEIRKKVEANEAAIQADSTATVEPVEYFENQEECQKVSYAFGNDIGTNLRESKLPLYLKCLLDGFKAVRENTIEMTENEIQDYLQNYFMVVRPKEMLEKSEAWLKKMEKKSGVKKTESGLLYKVVKEGDMTLAAKNDEDVVKVNYEGKNTEGKVFDSSYERNEPAEFPLNRVIKGWTEGMKLVGVGGEIILYIHPDMAYGARGAGRDIGPNEALEFKVELLEVKPHVEEAPAENAEEAPKAEK